MANFKFGTNSPFYSDREPKYQSSSTLGFGAMALTGAAAFGSGFIPLSGGGRLFDKYYQIANIAGHASPYGLLSSLRVPEIISPLLSPGFQSNGAGSVSFGSEFLQDKHTLKYLSDVTGHTESSLQSLGIRGDSGLRFTRHSGWRGLFGSGRLDLVTSQGHSVNLSNDIMLAERTVTSNDAWTPKRSVNQFAEALGTVIDENNPIGNTFNRVSSGVSQATSHRFIPTHSFVGSVGSINDLWNRATYPRALSAFKAQRLNRAMGSIAENLPLVGEIAKRFLNTEGSFLKNGSTLKMYGRYFGLAGTIGAVGLGISQYDYFMRYHSDSLTSELGKGMSSTAIGFGISLLASKITKSPVTNLGFYASAAAFGIQNIFSGFNKGVVAGTVDTLSKANSLRANLGEITNFSPVRRKLEDVMPGSTSLSTGVAAGLFSLGTYSLRHYKDNRYYKYYKHVERLASNKSIPFANLPDKVKALSGYSDLTVATDAWEKISYNLKPGHDLASAKTAMANGTWKRSKIPGQALNDRFEKAWTSRLAGAPWVSFTSGVEDKMGALFKHFSTSEHAKFKGFTGAIVAFGAGFLLHSLLSFKTIGSIETPEQLKAQREGKELVPVRKSRWWGNGGNPYEGGKISYYKPSLTATVLADTENTNLWGDEVSRYSPISRWFLTNFTHHLENKNLYSHPVPMSSPGFSTIPFFGKILGMTIGSVVKPREFYRADEWAQQTPNGSYNYLNIPSKLASNSNIDIGGTGIGVPKDPYKFGEIFADFSYRMREAAGLVGFAENQLQNFFTGSDVYNSGRKLLAESSETYDPGKSFWNMELGGLATLSEIPRRFFPKERVGARDRYNPLSNSLPEWLPKELRIGDQYATMANGFSRLPGAGFASLHPELKSIDANDYPLWYRYEILADVAPYSDEYRQTKNRIFSLRKKGQLTKEQEQRVDVIDKQVASQRIKRNYWIESDEQRNQGKLSKFVRNTYFGIIDTAKDLASPLEYLVVGGFRPTQKFLPVSNVLKDYERYAIYGSETSFWDFSRAWKDYLGPSFYTSMNLLGWNGIPPELERKRDIDQYFDRLNYYKYMKLSEEANNNHDGKAAKEYKLAAHKTVYGTNPFGNPLSIYTSLPQAEKDRYEGFSRLYKDSDRKELLHLLPDDQKPLFNALWQKQDGVKVSQQDKEKFSDSYKMRELESYFNSHPLPREDWIGMNPQVNINDIKLSYIEDHGYSMFDFGFYPSDKSSLSQKPYLEGAQEGISYQPIGYLHSLIRSMNHSFGGSTNNIVVQENRNGFSKSSYVAYINDDRSHDIKKEYHKWNEN